MSKPKKKLSAAAISKKVLHILERARREPRFQKQRQRDALIDAIRYGQTEITHALLAHGVDPNSTDKNGKSALWHAAYWTRSDLIRDLVKRGAKLPDDVLMGPVKEGDAEIVRFLIRHGANVNCIAAYTRYSNKFPKKEVLLTEAIENISKREFVSGIGNEAQKPKTSRGPDENFESIPIMLIKAGAKVNRLANEYSFCEGFVRTILGLAALRGREKVVKAMLTAGADVNQRDTWGGTALINAAQAGHENIVKILLAAGANAKLKRHDGTTVAFARERGFTDLVNAIGRCSS